MAKVNLIEGEKYARQGTFIDLAKAAEPAFKAAELKIARQSGSSGSGTKNRYLLR